MREKREKREKIGDAPLTPYKEEGREKIREKNQKRLGATAVPIGRPII